MMYLGIDQHGRKKMPSIVMHDRGTKFTKEFVKALEDKGMRTNKLPIT